MHLFDIEHGLMGGNGIIGGGIPLALGTAYSAQYRKNDRVTVCFFSEGASNQGTFHEAMNMASLWKLPLVFACENNLFAATTPSYKALSYPDIARRAGGYAMPGVIADGNDVLDVYEKTRTAVERARSGEGPALLEFKTYRVEGHCMVLNDLPVHRPENEVEYWRRRDPVDVFEKKLVEGKTGPESIRGKLEREVEEEFNEAIEYAKSSPLPDIENFRSIAGRRYAL
jgi:TPP-dependent pyruvate/acetoin dehydrogenase alpha subunit